MLTLEQRKLPSASWRLKATSDTKPENKYKRSGLEVACSLSRRDKGQSKLIHLPSIMKQSKRPSLQNSHVVAQ